MLKRLFTAGPITSGIGVEHLALNNSPLPIGHPNYNSRKQNALRSMAAHTGASSHFSAFPIIDMTGIGLDVGAPYLAPLREK